MLVRTELFHNSLPFACQQEVLGSSSRSKTKRHFSESIPSVCPYKSSSVPRSFGKTLRVGISQISQPPGALLNEDFVHPDPPGLERFMETADGDWRRSDQIVHLLETRRVMTWLGCVFRMICLIVGLSTRPFRYMYFIL